MTPYVVANIPCHTGEGPLWHPDEHCLYFVDIPAGRLYRYDPETRRCTGIYEDRPIGGFTLQADGALLLFRDRGNVAAWRNGKIERTVIDCVPELLDTRFNDVCADPMGRVFCGSMSSPHSSGKLFRLETDGSLKLLIDGLGTPNGMGFSPDMQWMYFNDSRTGITWRFAYRTPTGELSSRQPFRNAGEAKDPGNPDGLAVDTDGYVWTARWDGSAVLRFAPNGGLATQIDFPVKKVSSLCFGGEALDDLYATSAGGHQRAENGEAAGSLFRIAKSGFKGLPRFRSRIEYSRR